MPLAFLGLHLSSRASSSKTTCLACHSLLTSKKSTVLCDAIEIADVDSRTFYLTLTQAKNEIKTEVFHLRGPPFVWTLLIACKKLFWTGSSPTKTGSILYLIKWIRIWNYWISLAPASAYSFSINTSLLSKVLE